MYSVDNKPNSQLSVVYELIKLDVVLLITSF